MKLKNKLLPFIGITATIATAAPLALTSCKSNGIELIDITDGTKAIPTIDPMESDEWMGQTAYTTAYVKAVKANPEIFKQDFIYGLYQRSAGYSWMDYDYMRVGLSDPTFGVVNISYPGEPDVQYPTISLTYKIQYSRNEEYVKPSSYFIDNQVYDLEATLKDVPFIISPRTEQTGPETYVTKYRFSLPTMYGYSYIWKFNLNPWSINYSYDLKQTHTLIDSSGKTVTEDNKNDAGTLQSYSDISEDILSQLMLDFYSHHLSAITLAPEFIAHEMQVGGPYTTTSVVDPVPAVPGGTGSLTSGISAIPHKYAYGLYMPRFSSQYLETIVRNTTISAFAGYDADGTTKLPIELEQVLPEGSTASPVYIQYPVDAQAYIPDAGSLGDGWAATWTGSYDGASYIPYQFPEGKIVDADRKDAALKPTITTAGIEAFTFKLPKSIMFEFVYKTEVLGEEVEIKWTQEAWLNQDTMTAYVDFEA